MSYGLHSSATCSLVTEVRRKRKKMSYANKAAVLLFAFVLCFSYFMAPAAPPRAELASSPELTPEAMEQIDTWYDTLNQPGYTATVAPLLAEWVETGEASEEMVTKRDGSVSAMVVVAPWADRDAIEALVNVEMVMDLKIFTTMSVSIPSADRISMLAEIEGVGLIDSNLYRFEREDDLIAQTFQWETPTEGIDMEVIKGVVGATSGAAVNYDGTGVVVGHVDTGCDFGNPDLRHALDPGTYDGTGLGMAMSWYHANSTPVANLTEWTADPYNMLTYESGGDIYLNVTDWDPLLNGGNYGRYLYGDGSPGVWYKNRVGFIWLYAGAWGVDVGQILDYIQEDWKLPAPTNVQGNYSVGWIFQQRWTPYAKFFAPVMVYNATADNTNKLILNWEDSMGWLKMWNGAFRYKNYDLTDIFDAYEIIMEFDFDFTDEFAAGEIFDLNNPIVTHDYDGDLKDDVSFGSLCWGYDAAGWFVVNATTGEYNGDPIFNGFRSDRDMFCLFYDDDSHGTSTATHIAGIGNTYYNFDNESTFQMTGIAPGADILSVKALTGESDYFSYIWACGFDMTNITSREMTYTGNHRADLITNSWGWVTEPSSQFAYYSLTWDILSTPLFLDPAYPGVLHVFSAGNEGSGFMTTGPPGSSPGVLTVGASTTSHWLDYLYGPDQMDYEGIASFSSKGPSFSGYIKPDIVAPGLGGYAGMPLYGVYFNDIWLPSYRHAPGHTWYNYTMFAGTSQAAPVAAGVAALVYEALGGVVNPAQVKNILQYTAVDLGYDPATQGFGRVDAEAACNFVVNDIGMVGASTDSWNYFANFIGDAWAYWGVLPESWTGLDVNSTTEAYPLDNYEGSLFFGQVMAGDVVTNHLSLYDNAADMYDTPMTWDVDWGAAAGYWLENETYMFTSTTFSYNDTVVIDEQMYGYFNLSEQIGSAYDASEGLYWYMTVGVSFDAGDVAGNESWMFLYDWEDLNDDGMPNLWNASSGEGSELSRITSASDVSNTNMMPFARPMGVPVGAGLDGDIVLVIHDPIHDYNQTMPGNDFTCTVIFWGFVEAPELKFAAGGTTNTVNVTLTAPAEVGIHLGYAMVSDGVSPFVKIPYSYTVVANLTADEGEVNTIVEGYGAVLEPYDNAMYGCMDGDPDDWDFRTLVVHNNLGEGYLGIRVIWADTGNDMYVSVLSSEGLELANGHGMTATTTAVIAAVTGDGDYYLHLHPIALNGTLGLPVEYDVEVMWYSDLGTEEVIVTYDADNLPNPIPMAVGETIDEDTATGDHVVINASYPAFELVNMPEYEVTGITISFLAGVYFHETRDLVIPDSSYDPFSGPIQFDEFDWMFVDGIKNGDTVDIEVDFTNGDCDVMVWWTSVDNSTWTYDNNLVGSVMATGAHPEVGSFTADRDGEIAVGCFDYDLAAGTWTLTVDTRVGLDIPAVGPECTYDTYQFLKNGSFQVLVAAVTETNIDFDVNYPSFTFNNFFAPEMLTVTVAGTGASKTISWTSSDLNAGDEHFYEVLISADSGESYQLIATNVTTGSYVWDSTSFLARDTYRAMVRVYDNDPTENPDAAATGEFWMGLTDSLESSVFSAGTLTETTTTDTTPTTTTTTVVQPFLDPLWIGLIAGIGAGVVVVLILFLVKKR